MGDLNGQNVVCEKVVDIDKPNPKNSQQPEMNAIVEDVLDLLPEENILKDVIDTKETELESKVGELTIQLDKLKIENELFKKKLAHYELTKEAFFENNSRTTFLTSLDNYQTLYLLFDAVAPYLSNKTPVMAPFSQLIITLMRLRLNLSICYLSDR